MRWLPRFLLWKQKKKWRIVSRGKEVLICSRVLHAPVSLFLSLSILSISFSFYPFPWQNEEKIWNEHQVCRRILLLADDERQMKKAKKREKQREERGERREREKEGGVFPMWRLNVWHDCEQAQVGTCLGLRKGERASRRSAFRGRSMTSREFASNYRVSATYSSLSLTHPSLFLFHFLSLFFFHFQCSFRSSCFIISISFLLFSFYFIYFKFHFKW